MYTLALSLSSVVASLCLHFLCFFFNISPALKLTRLLNSKDRIIALTLHNLYKVEICIMHRDVFLESSCTYLYVAIALMLKKHVQN